MNTVEYSVFVEFKKEDVPLLGDELLMVFEKYLAGSEVNIRKCILLMPREGVNEKSERISNTLKETGHD